MSPSGTQNEWSGRVAVVTGGASGIGACSAERFLEEGASVAIGDLQEGLGAATCRRLEERFPGRVLFVRTDVRHEDEVERLISSAAARFGRLDVMFNNAGFGGALGGVAETDVCEFDLTFEVLVRGVFLGMKHATPHLRRNGGGVILNTGSVAGLDRAGYSPHAYAAAKAAVSQLTRSVAVELAPEAIRVNCIAPGFIATPLGTNTVGRSAEELEAAKGVLGARQPVQRAGEPADIAEMALYLASDRASYITGQTMVVDGGLTAGESWDDQPSFHKKARPIKVYRPEG